MTQPQSSTAFPLSAEISFSFDDHVLCKLPGFLFQKLIITTKPSAEDDDEYQEIGFWVDHLPSDQNSPEIRRVVNYLQTHISWSQIEPFVKLSADSFTRLSYIWEQKHQQFDKYRIEVRRASLPSELFFYMPFNRDRILQLFQDNKVYLRSPCQFNDPFDCSNDEQTRLACIEWGMLCFSAKNDDILMFSHYADHHRGLCVGVDPSKIDNAMSDSTIGAHADIRQIWYFKTMPPLDFLKEPALCVTCKHEIWSYEQEYRLFLVRHGIILPFGLRALKPNAFTSIIFGCRASDEAISFIKSITSPLRDLKYFKAERQPNVYGVHLLDIRKL